MLAFALIFALTAHSALAKPTGNCIFMCDVQPGSYGSPNGAYMQPGFGQGGYTTFGRPVPTNYGYNPGSISRIEDFGTEPVYPSYNQPAHVPQRTEQIPVQPEIDGLFTHSSSKSSFESNNGYLKIHQPGRSVIAQEPIRQPYVRPRPARICQDVYDPCNY